jgi:hypothetical protein
LHRVVIARPTQSHCACLVRVTSVFTPFGNLGMQAEMGNVPTGAFDQYEDEQDEYGSVVRSTLNPALIRGVTSTSENEGFRVAERDGSCEPSSRGSGRRTREPDRQNQGRSPKRGTRHKREETMNDGLSLLTSIRLVQVMSSIVLIKTRDGGGGTGLMSVQLSNAELGRSARVPLCEQACLWTTRASASSSRTTTCSNRIK